MLIYYILCETEISFANKVVTRLTLH